MGYKLLEHDGNEDFLKDSFPDRESFDKFILADEKRNKANEEKEKEKAQEDWLNLENPFIWEGDID